MPAINPLATRWSVLAQPSADISTRARRCSVDDSRRLAEQAVLAFEALKNSRAVFHHAPEFLLPSHAFLPFWVDGAGNWLILMGEPLLNNPALVELFWDLKQAGTRFSLHS